MPTLKSSTLEKVSGNSTSSVLLFHFESTSNIHYNQTFLLMYGIIIELLSVCILLDNLNILDTTTTKKTPEEKLITARPEFILYLSQRHTSSLQNPVRN